MKRFMLYCAIALTCITTQIPAFESCWDNSCCQRFNGLYFGGNIGAGSYSSHLKDQNGFLSDTKWKKIDTSIVGGAQAGFDLQNGNGVFGLVGDWNSTDLGRKIHQGGNGTHSLEADLNWYSTLRARAGLTFGNALFFVTGGAAVADFKTTWKDADAIFKDHKTRWGWTAGAGAEIFCWNNLTVGVDVLYMQFVKRTHSIATGADTFTFGNHDSTVVGRVSVNYRFGDLSKFW